MPIIIRKVVVHGHDVISQYSMPIRKRSEICLEAQHKEIRKERLSHTRKASRADSNSDFINRLVIASDHLLAFHRKIIFQRGKENNHYQLEISRHYQRK